MLTVGLRQYALVGDTNNGTKHIKTTGVMVSLSNHGAVGKHINTMKQYFVYILRCRDNSYYTGVTNNLEGRLFDHQQGTDPKAYTFKRRPVKLVFCEMFNDINQAIAFEKQVKGWRRAKKETIISGDWELLPGLSKNNI